MHLRPPGSQAVCQFCINMNEDFVAPHPYSYRLRFLFIRTLGYDQQGVLFHFESPKTKKEVNLSNFFKFPVVLQSLTLPPEASKIFKVSDCLVSTLFLLQGTFGMPSCKLQFRWAPFTNCLVDYMLAILRDHRFAIFKCVTPFVQTLRFSFACDQFHNQGAAGCYTIANSSVVCQYQFLFISCGI